MFDLGFPGGASVKEPACQCRRHKRCGFDPWVQKIPWKKMWQPTLVFLPGEYCEQRSLAGYGPQSHKEWDTTEASDLARRCAYVIYHSSLPRCWWSRSHRYLLTASSRFKNRKAHFLNLPWIFHKMYQHISKVLSNWILLCFLFYHPSSTFSLITFFFA